MATDPIVLGAELRGLLESLHGRNDVVVRFKTNKSGFEEDALSEDEAEQEGYYRADKRAMVLNLDALTKGGKRPEHLATLEDVRKAPILAGAAAHKSANARWSLWGTSEGLPFPETIPNPNYDPDDVATHTRVTKKLENQEKLNPVTGDPVLDVDGDPIYELVEVVSKVDVPPEFPVDPKGKLASVANDLEEARVERLGTAEFSKTWRKALTFSAGHFVLEKIAMDDESEATPLDAAVGLVIQVSGRLVAGTLGTTPDSRQTCRNVLESAQKIIEKALQDNPLAIKDPFHAITGIISEAVMNNDHEDPTPMLEYARRIQEIVYPEDKDNPDNSGRGPGSGGAGAGGEGGEGGGESFISPEMLETLKEMSEDLADMVQSELAPPEEVEWEQDPTKGGGGGHGSTLYKNPRAPQVNHHEPPNAADRELYRKAVAWMEAQVEPTIIAGEAGQWLPTGGARLNVRSYVRDNLANHKATQRTDWDAETQEINPAPPVKVGIMLDGSGSMHAYARPSAAIAWAAANAAAALPEARTASVVYGNAAQVTQVPGHEPARDLAVSNTDGGTEAFHEAAMMIEETLWLDEPVEGFDAEFGEGRTNVLIVIVSDLHYGGRSSISGNSQAEEFARITRDWKNRGFNVVVVGTNEATVSHYARSIPGYLDSVTIVDPANLFDL